MTPEEEIAAALGKQVKVAQSPEAETAAALGKSSPTLDFQPAKDPKTGQEYPFKTAVGPDPNGNPATIRDDGAINFPGQSNWLFYDPKTQNYAPAPSEPWKNKGMISGTVGADALAESGRNFGIGTERAVNAGLSMVQKAIPASWQPADQAQTDQAAQMTNSERIAAINATQRESANKYQDLGQMAPAMAATMLAPAAGLSFLGRVAPQAAVFGATTGVTTEGGLTDRLRAARNAAAATLAGSAALEKVAVPVVQTGLNQLGKIPQVGAAGRHLAGKLGLPTVPATPWREAYVPTTAAPTAPVATDTITPEVVGATARKAAGRGLGSKAAKTELAEMAQFNPESKAAADRLGMEFPADVLSDNPQVRAAAGLTRSVAGSDPEAAWVKTVKTASDRADEVLQSHDAHFAGPTTSPGAVSEKVNKALTSERAAIAKQASDNYTAVDSAIPKETPVQMTRLESGLAEVEREVTAGGMSQQEKRLLAMLKDNPTYGRIIREKNLIGKAIGGQRSPYDDMDTASLKKLYSWISEDQLAIAGEIGGPELRSQLHGANLLYAQQKALESRIVGAFGNTMEGSISGQMRNAITQSAKGDTKDFAKLIKTVPADLQRETLMTALADATRSRRGVDQGGFGFSEFAKIWPGIKANPTVYGQMERSLGPETVAMLNDLHGISQRLTQSRANVLTTGKANQALVNTMAKQTAFENLLDSTVSQAATTAAGAMGGGPAGAAATSLLHQAISKGGRDPLRAVGNLFNSPEFLKLVEKVSTGAKPAPQAVEAVIVDPRFQAFAAHVKGMPKGVANQAAWLTSRLATSSKPSSTLPAAAGEPDPTVAKNR